MNIKQFLQIEGTLAQTKSLEKSLELSLNDSSSEIVSHYLRAWRGRNDLSKMVSAVIPGQGFASRLNQIRSLIRQDLLEEALDLIDSCETHHPLEKIELELEKSRCSLFQKNYQNVINLTSPLLNLSETPDTTRMTILQVRGIAKTYSGLLDSAIDDLDQALLLASTLATAPSAYGALTVKAQAYSCLKNKAKADECLRMARSILDSTIDTDMWLERMLSFLRAQVRFDFYFSSETQFIKTTSTAKCVAEWLQAQVVVRLCNNDLAGRFDHTVALPFLGGKYIPSLKVILCDLPRSITCLEDSPQASQVIELLCKKNVTKSELFETVWGYRYNEAIHNPHLRNTLSRLRKYLPKGTLNSDNNLVSLKK